MVVKSNSEGNVARGIPLKIWVKGIVLEENIFPDSANTLYIDTLESRLSQIIICVPEPNT